MWIPTQNIRPTLERIAVALEATARQIGYIRFVSSYPGQITIETISERKVWTMSFIQFKIGLPPVVDADVVSRELSVQIGDEEPKIETLGITEEEVFGYEGPQDTHGVAMLTNIDDAGNRSEPSVASFILADTIPPAQPGEMSIVAVGEREEEEPVPETPEPEPAADTVPYPTPVA